MKQGTSEVTLDMPQHETEKGTDTQDGTELLPISTMLIWFGIFIDITNILGRS